MATLFFSRNGKDPNRAESKAELSMATVMHFFEKHNHQYFSEPPGIHPDDNPSPFSAYTNVVIGIKESEVNNKFAKAGFYWFPTLEPVNCKDLVGLDEL